MRFLEERPDEGERLADFVMRAEHAYGRGELHTMFSRRQLERAIAAGDVVPLGSGVFAAHSHRASPLVRAETINLWWPRAWVSGELALHLFEPLLPIPRWTDVITGRGHHRQTRADVRVRQIGPLNAYVSGRGVRCAPPEIALLDAWHRAEPHRREDVLYAALWARVCSWKQLRAHLRRAPRIKARRQLEAVLAWFEQGAHSPLEVRALRDVFTGPQFVQFERQAEIVIGDRRVRADMLHRAAKLIVEVDGAGYHGGYGATRADHRRDADLAAAGYLTLRFGWDDIVKRPQWCRQRVLGALAARPMFP